MRPLAILAGAAALAILAACAHRGPSPPPTACGAGSRGVDFVAAKVHVLQTFAFRDNGMRDGKYQEPVFDSGPPPEPYAGDLARAFDLAPAYLQKALCRRIDDVFIDNLNQAPFGWSFWEVSGQGSGRGRYIAVGGRLWNAVSAQATDLGGLETLILSSLLSDQPDHLLGQVRVKVNPDHGMAGPEQTPYVILAVLAREVGLVLNHDAVRHKAICGGAEFWQASWTGKLPSDLGVIHMLRDEPPRDKIHHTRGFTLPSEIRRLNHQNPKAAEQALEQVYGEGPPVGGTGSPASNLEWANLLANASPDGDFVETYRMIVLMDSGLQFLVVPLPGEASSKWPDVMKNLRAPGTRLADKVACVRINFAPEPIRGAPSKPAPAPR